MLIPSLYSAFRSPGALVVLVLSIYGCSDYRAKPPEKPALVAKTEVSAKGCSTTQLTDEVKRIASVTNGPVGAAITHLKTGETVSLEGDRHFPTQSMYKLPIGILVLRQVDAGKLGVDQRVAITPKDFVSDREFTIRREHPKGAELTIRELLRYMISESDGTACDVLLRMIGGPEAATKSLAEVGITDISIARYEREMFADWKVAAENWITPNQAVEILKSLQAGKLMSDASRALLLDLMINSRPGAKRIKGLLPAGTVVAHKTGTSATVNGITTATNDVGVVTLPDGNQLAVAVLVSDTRADLATREGVIARISKAAWDCWTSKQ